MYAITSFCHRTDMDMGRHGFGVCLSPVFRDAVKSSDISQTEVNQCLETMGAVWLDAAGYDGIYDPDNSGFLKNDKLPPGLRARRMYEPRTALRVTWGEWGPEHITVPGNACGLDLCDGPFNLFRGGKYLAPHNVDCWRQKYLLTIVFTELASHVISGARIKEQ